MNDYTDTLESIPTTPSLDVEYEVLGDFMRENTISGILGELYDDYNIMLDKELLLSYIEEFGIDITRDHEYRVADLIFENLKKGDNE